MVKQGKKITLFIQVCYQLNAENKLREIRGLSEARKELHSSSSGIIITEDYEAEEKMEGITVSFIPLWKWLLS